MYQASPACQCDRVYLQGYKTKRERSEFIFVLSVPVSPYTSSSRVDAAAEPPPAPAPGRLRRCPSSLQVLFGIPLLRASWPSSPSVWAINHNSSSGAAAPVQAWGRQEASPLSFSPFHTLLFLATRASLSKGLLPPRLAARSPPPPRHLRPWSSRSVRGATAVPSVSPAAAGAASCPHRLPPLRRTPPPHCQQGEQLRPVFPKCHATRQSYWHDAREPFPRPVLTDQRQPACPSS